MARTGVLPGEVRFDCAAAQSQCFMEFGMSSISPDGWQDLFPKQETLNRKS